uniref:ATP synthase subunit a n=1 Tax=Ophiacantha linea TaxID=1357420 RepID=V9NJU3_9ECHI|nr:ATP synthase F0 subunit 6 [Ophiacantha linea]AGQ49781.1 ATP synthase F0 subunit 6 [Ophiacantha linea]
MALIINNIFSQFNPITLYFIPLTIAGGLIAIMWVLFTNNQTHWASSRSSINFFLEGIFDSLIGEQPNEKAEWSPWIFSIFVLCLSYNLLSLIPYTFSHTSHLSFTFSLSLPMWIAFNINGFQFNWRAKISHLLPQGTPIFLIPLMIIIETISLFIQPLTLGFRLGANLLAGHLLIFLCACTIWEILINFSFIGIISFILIIILLILEIAVAYIQATVFLILSKNYLEENLNS